jgi:hypothetical protein
MKTAEEWLLLTPGFITAANIERIQSDAHRAGFSAGLEAGAKVCDHLESFTDIDGEKQQRHLNYHEIRNRIRALLAEATTAAERGRG